VESRIAACVNIVPQVSSIYRWQGKVEEAREWLLVIKTTAAAFEEVRQAITKLHSYDLPECVCLNVEDGAPNYLNGSRNLSSEKSNSKNIFIRARSVQTPGQSFLYCSQPHFQIIQISCKSSIPTEIRTSPIP